MEKDEARRGAVMHWQWIEKALGYNLETEGLNEKAVSEHRPDTGENESDRWNSSVSVPTAHQTWMSAPVKNFSSVYCHLCISSQVVSAHKCIRLNRLKIFTRSSLSNMPFCPTAPTPKILHCISRLAQESPSLLLMYTCQVNKRLFDSFQS